MTKHTILVIIFLMLTTIVYSQNQNISDKYFYYTKQLRNLDENSEGYFDNLQRLSNVVILDDSLSTLEKELIIQRGYDAAGYKYYKEAKYDLSVFCFTQVIQHSTRTERTPLYEVYFRRGNAYRLLKEYESAINDFSEAIELKNIENASIIENSKKPIITEEYSEAYNNRGVVYDLLEQYDKALADFEKVLEIDPYIQDKEQFIANKARVYARKGDYANALNEYGKALRLSPHNVTFFRNKAVVHIKNKQYDEAIYFLAKVLEYDPQNKLGYKDEVTEEIVELSDSLKNESYKISPSDDVIDKGYVPFDKSTPYQMSYLERFVLNDSLSVYPRFIEDGFYYVNRETGEITIPRRFNEAYPFYNNSALVRYNDKYAIINREGKYIVEPIYCTPEFKMAYSPYIVLIGDSAYDFISGKKLPLDLYLKGNIDPIPIFNLYTEKKGNKYGIKKNGLDEFIIEPIYDSIYYCDESKDFILAQFNNKIGVIDLQKKTKIQFENDSVILGFSEFGLSTYGLFNLGFWHYYSVDDNKELLKSPHKIVRFTDYNTFNPNVMGLYEVDGCYNILFKNGQTLPKNYDWIHVDGVAGIRIDIVYLILKDGSEIPYYNIIL